MSRMFLKNSGKDHAHAGTVKLIKFRALIEIKRKIDRGILITLYRLGIKPNVPGGGSGGLTVHRRHV